MAVRGGRHQDWLLEGAAAALLACACAFAATMPLLAQGSSQQTAAVAAVVSAGVAFAVAFAALRWFASAAAPERQEFEPAAMPDPGAGSDGLEELLLTQEVAAQAPAAAKPADSEFLLNDVLAELQPSARVVRLFDLSPIPTPGQLQARIDRHLATAPRSAPDASDALHQALADLRRSLR